MKKLVIASLAAGAFAVVGFASTQAIAHYNNYGDFHYHIGQTFTTRGMPLCKSAEDFKELENIFVSHGVNVADAKFAKKIAEGMCQKSDNAVELNIISAEQFEAAPDSKSNIVKVHVAGQDAPMFFITRADVKPVIIVPLRRN